MKVELPTWREEYEPRITEAAYNEQLAKATLLLNRALELYEAYLKVGNALLYDTFDMVMAKIYPVCRLLAYSSQADYSHISQQLAIAAEIVSGSDELPYKSTMLWDLAGCIRGSQHSTSSATNLGG